MDNPSDKQIFVENKSAERIEGESPGQGKEAFGFPSHSFVLLALILWTFGCNQIWSLLDARPLSWDPAAHLRIAFGYWSAFVSGSDRVWLDLLSVESFYPPFYHLSLLPVLAGLGFSADNAVMVNSFYMAVIILSTYGIGQRLYGRSTGLLAAFLISCYPFLAYISRQLSIGTALTAAVALSYYLFLCSENFENRKFSFWFSCSFAVGLLVKWTFIFYLLPAIIIGLFHTESDRPRKVLKKMSYYLGMIFALMVLPLVIFIFGKGREVVLILECALVFALVRFFPAVNISAKKIINILTLTFVSLLVCFPWYAHNLAKMSRGISKFGLPDIIMKGAMEWDLPIWGYYLEAAGRQMGMPLLLLFVVGFIVFLFNRKNFNWLLFGWIVLPFLVFTFINNKGVRYTMPCLTAVSVVSALFIIQISKSRIRNGALGLVIAVSLFTYIYAGFLPGDMKTPGFGDSFFGFKGLPVKENWHIDSILDDIVQESAPPPGKMITVRTLTNHPWFHRGAFRDAAMIRGLPVIVKSVKRNQGELTDYFITKDSSQEGESGNRQINPKRDRLFEDPTLSKTFSLFKTYPLPNGASGLVFKRDVSPVQDIEGAIDLKQVGQRFIEALPHYPIYGIKQIINPRISIVPTDDEKDLFLGRYKKITLTADSAVSNKIRLDDLELTFHDVQINLYELFLHGKLILFEIGRLFPRATIQFEPLEQLALKEMKGKGEAHLEGDGDRLRLRAQYQLPPPFGTVEGYAEVKLNFEPKKSIQPHVETVTVGPLAAREIFYRRILDEKIILTPTPGWPLFTDIRTINIFPRRLEINQSSKGAS
jgi:4-amino-4-deoxy-L-arabinose transferase-like glycosyltransferase